MEQIIRELKPIDKATFTYYMEKIIERFKLNEEIYSAIYSLTGGSDGKIGAALDVQLLVDMLANMVEDTGYTINYFIYDCNCGEDGANKIEVDGEYIPFETIEDLWNELIRQKENNNGNN